MRNEKEQFVPPFSDGGGDVESAATGGVPSQSYEENNVKVSPFYVT